jgi:ubiquinone biosynthesis UbiH/UbiF/VisC/COQ6 family hydroxylase
MVMNREFDVIVVGGGLAGAAFAVGLRATGLKIALVEASEQGAGARPDARMYAISPANQKFLSDLSIWQHLDTDCVAGVSAMRVFGDAGGAMSFSADETGLAQLAWIVGAAALQAELWATLKRQHNVTLFCPHSSAALSFDHAGAALTLADGQTLRTRLLVGADGVRSWVREQAGIEARMTPYGETAIVASFHCSRAHRGTAWQWFAQESVLALLPLPDQQVSMVWSVPDARANELLALAPDSLTAKVAEICGDAPGTLSLTGAITSFPLRMMRVDEVVRPRLALIGDAAHAIHPLSGHGINLGLQDAQVLAGVISALPVWRDPGELTALRAYARARAEEPLLLQFTTHALQRLFGTRNPFVSALRNTGMNLTERLPVIKNALVRYAASGRF